MFFKNIWKGIKIQLRGGSFKDILISNYGPNYDRIDSYICQKLDLLNKNFERFKSSLLKIIIIGLIFSLIIWTLYLYFHGFTKDSFYFLSGLIGFEGLIVGYYGWIIADSKSVLKKQKRKKFEYIKDLPSLRPSDLNIFSRQIREYAKIVNRFTRQMAEYHAEKTWENIEIEVRKQVAIFYAFLMFGTSFLLQIIVPWIQK